MRNIWAIARVTLSHALRLNIALVFIALLAVLIPVMSVTLNGDGTLLGKCQSFVSYSFSLMSIILCILTIIISAYTLSDEFKRKYLYIVLSKPIHRAQIVVGKLLGILLIDIMLLAGFCFIIGLLSLLIPRFSETSDSEIAYVKDAFFNARAVLRDEIDREMVQQRAVERYREMEEKGTVPEGMHPMKVINSLRAEELGKIRNIQPGTERVFEFENLNVSPDPNEFIAVKFKFTSATYAPDERVHSNWYIGDLRQEGQGPGQTGTPVYAFERSDKEGVTQEIMVPANAVAEDGFLAIGVFNPFINQSTIDPTEVRILVGNSSYTGNLARAGAMILTRLIFLAALGVFASTWVSFPTCILIGSVFYFIGSVNSFIFESLEYFGENPSEIYQAIVGAIVNLLPRFDGPNSPNNSLLAGELIRLGQLGKMFFMTVCIKSLLLTGLGTWIFSKREIAKITV